MLRYLKHKFHEWLASGNQSVFYAPKRKRDLVATEQEIVDDFHNLYYRAWQKGAGTIDISWMGYRMLKCPLDLWIYQEIIFETRPDVLIETGTLFGGSALFFGCLFDMIGKGHVISIDIEEQSNRPTHPRVEFWLGSSVAPEIVGRLKRETVGKKVMVILDSDHAYEHVLEELFAYSPFVSQGCYLITEDTNVNGHPTYQEYGPGPMEAVLEFMKGNPGFEIDKDRERFMMTLNPNGYLRKL